MDIVTIEKALKSMTKEDLVFNLADIFMDFRNIDEDDVMSLYRLQGSLDYIFNKRLAHIFKDF